MKKRTAIVLAVGALILSGCSGVDGGSSSTTTSVATDVITQPSEWNTLEDVAESIEAITGGCTQNLHITEDSVGGGCGTAEGGFFLFAIDSPEHPNATTEMKTAVLLGERDEPEVLLWGAGWAIHCWENAQENCKALSSEFPSGRWVDLATSSEASALETSPASSGPTTTFGDGTHLVGPDIEAGTYRNGGASGACYWERLSGFGGTTKDIIANANPRGQAFVTIDPTDAAFTSKRCGEWVLVE